MKAETLSVALSESEVKAETLSVALSESEVKAETLSVALSESEVKAETLSVALSENLIKFVSLSRHSSELSARFDSQNLEVLYEKSIAADALRVTDKDTEQIRVLSYTIKEMEMSHQNVVEEHTALIAYMQNELDLLQLVKNISSSPDTILTTEIEHSKSIIQCNLPNTQDKTPSKCKSNNKNDTNPAAYINLKKLSDYARNTNNNLLSPTSTKKRALFGPVNDHNTSHTNQEFSHMHGEMRRFRSARDEAKVSLSKMAGRVTILKDQRHEKVFYI